MTPPLLWCDREGDTDQYAPLRSGSVALTPYRRNQTAVPAIVSRQLCVARDNEVPTEVFVRPLGYENITL